MVEYALLISQSARESFGNLAYQVNSMAGQVNWVMVGAIVFALLFARAALRPPRI
ncbi:MAG TPA: hypothetical protein VK688_03970 [Gemmatimonadales bacterium]|nr:hypothetical protein [Gemmatimonadales bacterium]